MLMGAPGSGKGTQARLLVDHDGWLQISTGDLFRFHLTEGTALGKLAKSYMDRGAFVPDEVTIDMVRTKLGEVPATTRVVFDGFPRTVAQAKALEAILAERGRRVAAVVLIEVPRDALMKRLGVRATCAKCQAVYSLTVRPPAVPGVCDRCGGVVSTTTRLDESPEVVLHRFEAYDAQTRPVIAHYDALGLVERIDGTGAVDEIRGRLVRILG